MANTARAARIASCALLALALLACSDDTSPTPDTTTRDDAARQDDATESDGAAGIDAPDQADGAAKLDGKPRADGKARVDAARKADARQRPDAARKADARQRPDATLRADSFVKPDAPTGRSCLSFVSVSKCGFSWTSYTEGRFSSLKRVVKFGGTLGKTYSPKCLRINVGQRVTFKGTFGGHPLTQSCGPATAISGTVRSGISKSFTFTKRGYYGYYCRFHGSQLGNRMAGVIRVGL